ncbi:unnamed protein product [Mycena citricolor]|uniref:Enoyl reductase (ER) domain-containing protein n=1 Tax=Mycena citricolor TaxID=2018698 RepID=A0AAD2HWI9_9AGAR|nr:unnamed protein product [Mycena citricolor]CAK5283514.1 unnamed protein product [Mycena citricolor]
MAPVTNGRVLFNSVPQGVPVPGETTVYDTTETIDIENVPLNGGFLLKVLILSVDPYFRGRMKPGPSYTGAFEIGKPLSGFGIGKVLRSENAEVPVGKYIYGYTIRHEQYYVLPGLNPSISILEKRADLPLTAYIGAAGMPGQTAWCAWTAYSEVKAGETVFVTAAAGAVGSVVVQLAKRAGCKVIASAGSEDKCAFVKSLGADVVFNYKTTPTREVLTKEGPVDIYWDNVGGDTTDAAIESANVGARFLLCGSISGYNGQPEPLKNFVTLVGKQIHMHGFLAIPLIAKYHDQFYSTVPDMVAKGEIVYREDVTRGLETVGDQIVAVLKGTNVGKAIVTVADE